MFHKGDFEQIKQRGSDPDRVQSQLEIFQKGVSPAKLDRACSIGDGIVRLTEEEEQACIALYEETCRSGRFSKMTPASGAATRMFKSLYNAIHELSQSREDASATRFLDHLEQFAFYHHLKDVLAARGKNLQDLTDKAHVLPILKALLEKDGLNYGQLPKGLLAFHAYPSGPRTPAWEQLQEAAQHIVDESGRASVHFTVSPEHMELFKTHIAQVIKNLGNIQWDVTFSIQKPATDTIAANPDNTVFRTEDNRLLFRPAGHGALIENLNDLEGDLVFLKNIDNVVPDSLRGPTIHYKKALGGYLVKLQNKVFQYLSWLENNPLTVDKRSEILGFMETFTGFKPHEIVEDLNDAHTWLFNLLNRPIRVCGMVKNEGEPGGGPYWVHYPTGVSLQVVETSQMDLNNSQQAALVSGATHFNPVDLICGVRDYKGKPFNLPSYVDHDACFISQKSQNGKPLQALELPGLWNGAMAFWNTAFVETPLTTFNPVKTVFDLLRHEHQNL